MDRAAFEETKVAQLGTLESEIKRKIMGAGQEAPNEEERVPQRWSTPRSLEGATEEETPSPTPPRQTQAAESGRADAGHQAGTNQRE